MPTKPDLSAIAQRLTSIQEAFVMQQMQMPEQRRWHCENPIFGYHHYFAGCADSGTGNKALVRDKIANHDPKTNDEHFMAGMKHEIELRVFERQNPSSSAYDREHMPGDHAKIVADLQQKALDAARNMTPEERSILQEHYNRIDAAARRYNTLLQKEFEKNPDASMKDPHIQKIAEQLRLRNDEADMLYAHLHRAANEDARQEAALRPYKAREAEGQKNAAARQAEAKAARTEAAKAKADAQAQREAAKQAKADAKAAREEARQQREARKVEAARLKEYVAREGARLRIDAAQKKVSAAMDKLDKAMESHDSERITKARSAYTKSKDALQSLMDAEHDRRQKSLDALFDAQRAQRSMLNRGYANQVTVYGAGHRIIGNLGAGGGGKLTMGGVTHVSHHEEGVSGGGLHHASTGNHLQDALFHDISAHSEEIFDHLAGSEHVTPGVAGAIAALHPAAAQGGGINIAAAETAFHAMLEDDPGKAIAHLLNIADSLDAQHGTSLHDDLMSTLEEHVAATVDALNALDAFGHGVSIELEALNPSFRTMNEIAPEQVQETFDNLLADDPAKAVDGLVELDDAVLSQQQEDRA